MQRATMQVVLLRSEERGGGGVTYLKAASVHLLPSAPSLSGACALAPPEFWRFTA